MEKRIVFSIHDADYHSRLNPFYAVTLQMNGDYLIKEDEIHISDKPDDQKRVEVHALKEQTAKSGILISDAEVQRWGFSVNEIVWIESASSRIVAIERFCFVEKDIYILVPAGELLLTTEDKKEFFRKVPTLSPELVEKWDIRMGDVVKYSLQGNQIVVLAINGRTQKIMRSHFMKHLVGQRKLAHSVRELNSTICDNLTMKILRAKAPFGLGALSLILGPSKSGKTWTARAYLDAVLACTDQELGLKKDNTVIICLSVGERVGDARKMAAGLARYPHLNTYFFTGATPATILLNAELSRSVTQTFVTEGYDVFYFLDSAIGLVKGLGQIKSIAGEGFASSGVPTGALQWVVNNYLFFGSVPGGGSLTPIVTSLYEGEKTSSGTVAHEIGKPTATSLVMHYTEKNPTTPRPWIDMTETGTRELEDMLNPERLQLHLDFAMRMERAAIGEKGFDAHKAILTYLRQFLLTIPFEEKAIRASWAREDADWAEREVQEAYRLIAVEAGAKLRSVPNKASVTFAMWRTAGVPAPEQVMEQLFVGLPPETRQRALALIQQKAGTISPMEQLLQAAQSLQGNEDAISALLKALRMIGVTPQEVLEASKGDPITAMIEVAKRLKAETGKGFTRQVAEKLVESGNAPEKVYEFLKAGGTPSNLYGQNGNS